MERYIWLGVFAAIMCFILRRLQVKQGAKKIFNLSKAMYSTQHEYWQTSPEAYPFLDKQFYWTVRKSLEAEGFTFVADLEDVTLKAALPKLVNFVRVMASDDGTTMAGCYHFKNRSAGRMFVKLAKMPLEAKIVEFETEFTDGSFLQTSNSLEMDRTGSVPGIKRVQLSGETPWAQILEEHRRQVQIEMQLNAALRPRPIRTVDDVIEALHRQQELKNRHKKDIGYINRDELQRIAGENMAHAVDVTMQEVDKLKQKDASTATRGSIGG